MTKSGNAGFTLIEMSIVLMIIGFIVAGIFLGQSLIRQSQVNSIMTDAQKYIQAVQNFQQKYNSLPGDFANATTYWGAMSTCPPTAGMASPGGTLTCNGNGNGQIENGPEDVLAWQHLIDAQMIQGHYTGIPGSLGNYDNVIGVNIPASRVEGAGFGIFYVGIAAGSNSYYTNNFVFGGTYGHIIILGGYDTNAYPDKPVLTTIEAQAVDSKHDDGNPSTGNITSVTPSYVWSSDPNCAVTSGSTYGYKVSYSSGYACSLIFTTGF